MEHLAIDLGGRESQICVRSIDGQIVKERRWRTRRCRRIWQGRDLLLTAGPLHTRQLIDTSKPVIN